MKKRAIFFSDIDGTLLKRNMAVPRPVIEAAGRFMRAGGLLSLCTGRALHTAAPIAAAMGVNTPCIICGGAAVYDFEAKEYIYTRPCDGAIHECVRRLFLQAPEVSIQVYTQAEIYMYRNNRILAERGNRMDLAVPVLPPFEIKGEVMKVLITCEDTEVLARCGGFFPKEKFDFAFASRHFAEITPAGASKGDTVTFLAGKLGIPLANCFAAGDGHTDLPMLRIAGESFAPADAADDIRSVVSRVVPCVDEAGMAEAFAYATERIDM